MNFRLVLVGGAPRSGTTVLHGLLCTSPKVNDFLEEASYLGFLLRSWTRGAVNWDRHTFDFHDNKSSFSDRIRSYVISELDHIWRHVGRPEVLALKDPTITPELPLIMQLLPEATIALSVRHPYAVVRSRQEVFERQTGRSFTTANAAAVADEFALCYENQPTSTLFTRYEDFPNVSSVSEVLGLHLNEELLWKPKGPAVRMDNPWWSPKYGARLDVSSRLPPLAKELREVVDRRCGLLIDRFGYDRAHTDPAHSKI